MKLEQGNKYSIDLEEESLEGVFINEVKGLVYIKLKSGYNIGIKKSRIKKVNKK